MTDAITTRSTAVGLSFSHKMTPEEMSGATTGKPKSAFDQILSEFQTAASETPTERATSAVLKKHGLTRDSLNRLPRAEKEAILKEIQEAVKRTLKVEDKNGTASRLA